MIERVWIITNCAAVLTGHYKAGDCGSGRLGDLGDYFCKLRYKSSTFFLAQGVFLRNFKLDLMLGSLVKQRISMCLPNSTQPYCSTNRSRIFSSVMPCKGLLVCCSAMFADFIG